MHMHILNKVYLQDYLFYPLVLYSSDKDWTSSSTEQSMGLFWQRLPEIKKSALTEQHEKELTLFLQSTTQVSAWVKDGYGSKKKTSMKEKSTEEDKQDRKSGTVRFLPDPHGFSASELCKLEHPSFTNLHTCSLLHNRLLNVNTRLITLFFFLTFFLTT